MPLKIMPHGRLQEWVAEEKGFFTAEGLDYTFLLNSGDYGMHAVQRDERGEVRTGAFETFGAGRDGADVSCACHWATNAATGERSGQLVTTAYSVAPCAIVVPPESPDRRPELYKHCHLRSVPEKYRDQVDVRAFGTGERIVFLEYTRENFEATRQWTQAHDLFSGPPSAGYDQAALV